MSVFISYSSKDREFVDKLAMALVQSRIKVWLDRWEMQVGDSLLDKIQDALTDSSYLLVVLSESSVNSEWCNKELKVGLIREIEEKRVHVIPILIDNCKIPAFLKDKLFADFRKEFNSGMTELLKPLQKLVSENMGRKVSDDFIVDFALNWGLKDKQYFFDIDFATWFTKEKKSCLIQLTFLGNDLVFQKYVEYMKRGLPWMMKEVILEMVNAASELRDLRMLIHNDKVYYLTFKLGQPDSHFFDVTIRAVQMGVDNTFDMLISLSEYLDMLNDGRQSRLNDYRKNQEK